MSTRFSGQWSQISTVLAVADRARCAIIRSAMSNGGGRRAATDALGAAEKALAIIDGNLALSEEVRAASHVVVRTTGCGAPGVAEAIGVYLTAGLAGMVRVDINLAERFLGASFDPINELRRRVERVAGADNNFNDEATRRWRDTRRNPWLAEGIGHLLLFMAGRARTGCLAGLVKALKPLHAVPTQQGLDLVAIYVLADLPMLVIGECKATHSNPSGHLTDAATFFRRLERGDRDADLVGDVTMLEQALSVDLRRTIGEAYWQERRTYLPLIVYGVAFEPHAEREVLKELAPAREHKRVVVFELPGFYAFFDHIADSMRRAIGEIVP